MSRNLALIAMFAGGLVAAGCRDDGGGNFTPADFSRVTDMSAGGGGGDGGGGGGDMAIQKMYTQSTPHDIDTGGASFVNKAVKLSGMVLTTPVTVFISKGSLCKYEAWVQDPACTTPPCGLVVISNGTQFPVMDASARDCPPASQGMSMLANVTQGDTVDLTGIVDTGFKPTGVTIDSHEIELDSVTKTGNATITPMVVTDPAIFVNNMGTSWAMYEGTLITLQPATPPLTVTNTFPMNRPTFQTTPGNATWAYTFLFNAPKVPVDGGGMLTFPVSGQKFNSITAVVSNGFGGQLLPRTQADFNPQNGL